MKKVLACLLVLTMVLGSFSVAFAGSYTDVADNASYAQAVEVLTSLGLVKGDGDGTYRPADAVKRSEMAKLIVVALGYGDFAAAQKATKFSDVPASHWASGYISFASDLGIIEGVGAGKFNPDVTVSFDEAITMLVRALGYADDKLPGSWPTDMVVKAMDLEIITKTQVGSTGAARGDVAEMLYKTLTKQEATWSALTGTYVLGTTLLEGLGYEKQDAALVLANESDALLKGHIGEYGVAYTDKATGKAVAFVPSSVELAGTVKSVNGKVVFAVGSTNYEFKTDAVRTLTAGTWVALTNGVAAEGGNAVLGVNEVRVLDVKLEAGKIAQVYAVGAWIDPVTVAVTKAEAANIVKTNLTSAATINSAVLPMSTDGKSVDVSKIVLNGVSALSEIKENSVVTYYVGGGKITRMDVSNAVVVGQISQIAADGKLTINGVVYEATSALAAAGKALGAKGTWTLDAAGKLFAFTGETPVTTNEYAVIVLAAGSETTGGSYDAAATTVQKIKLFKMDGTTEVAVLGGTASEALTLKEAWDDAAVVGKLVKLTRDANGKVTAIEAVGTAATGTTNTVAGVFAGKLVASDVVVVLGNADATKLALGTTADITKSALSANTLYLTNTAGAVSVIYLAPADKLVTVTSPMGIFTSGVTTSLAADGKTAVYTVNAIVNGVAGTYEVTSSAQAAVAAASKTEVYTVTLTSGKISGIALKEADAVAAGTVAGVSGNLVSVASAGYLDCTGATVYVAQFNASNVHTGWAVGSIADVAKDSVVTVYKLGTGSAQVDLIFVENNANGSFAADVL